MYTVTNLKYLSYTTGPFHNGRYDGICLQFICNLEGKTYHTFFNVNHNRKRNVAGHKAGDLLPKGRFSVGYRSNFYRFWISTGLDIPPRQSACNDYMGKLKQFTFSANLARENRLYASSIQVQKTNKSLTKFEQSPNNSQTRAPNKDCVRGPASARCSEDLSTGSVSCKISNQVGKNASNPLKCYTVTKKIHNQTHQEWIAEYETWSKIYDD